MNCQRCPTLRGSHAVARIRTDIMDLTVYGPYAQETLDLGPLCEAIESLDIHSRPVGLAAAT